MAEKTSNAIQSREFSYRNITKSFTTFEPSETVTKECHLERGEGNDIVIVDDRPTDWCEKANKDADKVGLANILEMVRRGQLDASTLSFSDDEGGMDLSGLDPMDPNSTKNIISSSKATSEKLSRIASQLGCSSDDLIKALLEGNLDSFIQAKVDAAKTVEGGKENA